MASIFHRLNITLLSTSVFLIACSADLPPIEDCEPLGGITPICMEQTSEDIAALPDGRYLLLAHYGGMHADRVGRFSLFDTADNSMRQLNFESVGQESKGWGQPECRAPEASISPHGTHLHQLAGGSWRYAVVNHAERESIELFEVIMAEADTQIEWRGCVIFNKDAVINDVVGFKNGDVAFSRMWKASDKWAPYKSALGFQTGEMWYWENGTSDQPQVMPDTLGSQANGVELSKDEKHIFVNMYHEQHVWKVDVASGKIVGKAEIANADNSAWGSDGRLWVATHNGGIAEILQCFDDENIPCPASSEIIALDTETLKTESIFEHRGAPMGAITVAVPQNGNIYMGSFAGDRIIYIDDPLVD